MTGQGKPHPRFYGTFSRILGHYVRDLGILPLSLAVHKMTGGPARALGLDGRGPQVERAGCVAVRLALPDGARALALAIGQPVQEVARAAAASTEPVVGDVCFSGKLAASYLTKDVWQTDVARFGIDIWMTTTAIANQFRTTQSFLGAKIHDAKDPSADLSAMLYQVVGSTFELMEAYADVWKPVRGSEPVTAFGFEYTVGLEQINVNTGRMLDRFREGLKNLREIWVDVLGAGDFREMERLGSLGDREFRFPLDLWTRIIYDYAIAFHQKKLPAEHLIKSLTPLYLGKTASFIIEVEHMGQQEAEAEIEKLCTEFEKNKDYLVASWK